MILKLIGQIFGNRLYKLFYLYAADDLPSSPSVVGSRSCVACPEGTWADPTGFQCVPCGVNNCQQCSSVGSHTHTHTTHTHSHVPTSSLQSTVAGGVCFETSQQLPSTPDGVFSYYSEHFSAAVALCQVRWYSLTYIIHFHLPFLLSPCRLATRQPASCWQTCVYCRHTPEVMQHACRAER